jgi:hypothetical protein
MNDSVFIFLGSKTTDNSQLFENHQIGFIENLYENNIIDFKHVLVSVYLPEIIDSAEKLNIKQKTEKMEEIARRYSFELGIIFIKGKTFKSLLRALKQIREKATPFTHKVIFSQNYHSGFIGLCLKQSLKNVYLHANLRGVPAEEELFYSRSFFLRRILNFLVLKWIEKKVIPGSDSLSVVSKQYKKYLDNKLKTRIKHIVVYPCAYDSGQFYVDRDLRKAFREKYQIKNHQKVFIYSGSMHKYQLPAKIFQFYVNISKQDSGENCVFIFLTLDKDVAQRFSKSFLIHNFIIESAHGKDLLGFYNASDIGVIIRQNDLVNRVASPTKIPEYLSTGNSVILTEGIGDYTVELRDKSFALIKKDTTDFIKTSINELMELKSLDENDLNWVKENYSNEKIQVYNEIFRYKDVPLI